MADSPQPQGLPAPLTLLEQQQMIEEVAALKTRLTLQESQLSEQEAQLGDDRKQIATLNDDDAQRTNQPTEFSFGQNCIKSAA